MKFNQDIYFDKVRTLQFSGSMTQQQVDGQRFALVAWETFRRNDDIRWLAYFLATDYHETAATMWPVEEYGKGAGMAYGEPDPETGQTYYGRGLVQLTWADNYKRADAELGLEGENSCYLHPERQLDCFVAARTGYAGMMNAWFRPPNNFAMYFNATEENPYGAREIINGDKSMTPSWSTETIGRLIEGYYDNFLDALEAAKIDIR